MAENSFETSRKQLLKIAAWDKNTLPLCEFIDDLAFWSKNISGQFVLANSLFLKMCQIQKMEDLYGKTDFDIWPDHLAENYVKDDQKVIRSGQVLHQKIEPILNSTHSTQFYHTSKFPLHDRDENVIGVIGICKDLKLSQDNVNPVMKMIPVIDFIKENYATKIDIKKLAEQMGENLEQFINRFTKLFQLNPESYVKKTRIIQSLQYASDPDLGPDDIAKLVGFETLHDFLNSFKEFKGVEFQIYRKQFPGN